LLESETLFRVLYPIGGKPEAHWHRRQISAWRKCSDARSDTQCRM